MSEIKKPSEKVLNSPFDGIEIEDSCGRKIKLKKPNLLDRYDLFSAMGSEDSRNIACLTQVMFMLHIQSIDGAHFSLPTSYAEVRATLKRIPPEVAEAVQDYLNNYSSSETKAEAQEQIKK